MYRQFKTVDEADGLLGREVTVECEKARLIEIKMKDRCLYFSFEYEDGTIEILNSLSAFYTVRIDGHLFGKYEEN